MPSGSTSSPIQRPRFVLVGARQARHGLGAHLARHLHAAGAEVVAVVGTRLATADQAAEALRPVLGHRPVALAHADDVERLPDLHAIAVASPHATHATWLRWAAARGLHALCEKPLVWDQADAVSAAGALARRFEQRGLHLAVLAQWPLALEAFTRLHPGVDLAHVTRLELTMEPPSRGAAMLPDALPHPLSLAYALAPHERPRLTDVEAAYDDELGRQAHATWIHVAGERRLEVAVRLAEGGPSPRGFTLTLDGRTARREVDPTTYAMRLVDGARSVPLPDPFAALAARFVARLKEGAPAPAADPSARFGVAHLQQLAEAFPALSVTEIPYP